MNKPLKVLQEEFPELALWLKAICRCSKLEDFIIADYKEKILRLKFYTKENSYFLTVNLPKYSENGKGYMMASFLSRKPRAGEDWNRGNDLADGPYSEKTWNRIVNKILSYELVKVVKPKQTKQLS